MANIKKSFNFRNGVQVDDDNLKVSATGLVGIGTTVPTEALDVRGNLVVSGVSSAVTLQAGVATITTLNPTEIIGAGVSIKSGIVTASSGIITYFGDGINLLNLPTSQWEDTIIGAGVSSIYNTGGNVGIATTAALFTLQVGNDVNSGQKGVGISSFGDVKASGIVTATGFVGNLTGNVIGDITGNITGGTVISGVSTFSELVDVNSDLDVDGHTNLDNVNVAGITTFAGIIEGVAGQNKIPALYANLSDLPNAGTYHGMFAHVHATGKGYYAHAGNWIELVNKDTSGDVSITGDVDVTGGITATGVISGQQVSGTVSVNTATLNATNGTFASTGSLSAQGGISVKDLRIATGSDRTLITTPVGVSTVTISGGDLKLQDKVFINGTNPELRSEGNITLSQKGNNLAKIGVGTISPANDIHLIRYSGDAELQVSSATGVAGITVGRELSTGNTNNGEIKYGGGSGFTYSSPQSLDIVNYGTGNVNYHLSANNAGAVNGDFHWHLGKSNSRLMTLTNNGRLGIGITSPTQALHVAGNAFVAGNFVCDDTIICAGMDVSGTASFTNLSIANIIGNISGNVNATSGLSTFFNIRVTDPNNNFAGIGIKTDNTGNLPLDIFGDGASTNTRLFVTDDARVGIKTDEINPGIDINAVDSRVVIQSMGVGTTNPQSAVDMRFAGKELTGIFANRMYMYPPQVTTTQRGNLAGVAAGALIYNTTTNKLQVYNGSAWQDCN